MSGPEMCSRLQTVCHPWIATCWWFVLLAISTLLLPAATAQPIVHSTDLYVSGKGGYHSYRIPTMAQAADGTLLAFAEARKNSASDTGDIDIVVRRSADNGVSWSAMKILLDDGENTMGQPSPVLDRSTGNLILVYCRNNREMFAAMFDEKSNELRTPRNLTAVSKSLDVPFTITRMGAGPCAGIQSPSGRLIVPVWVNGTIRKSDEYRAGIIFSDDGGQAWKTGGVPPVSPEIAGINESAVALLPDGRLYMTQRTNEGKPYRSFSTSDDDGLTWTTTQRGKSIAPNMAPIKAGLTAIVPRGKGSGSGILLSAPSGPGRRNLTVWYSPEGSQWRKLNTIHPHHSGYSELLQLANGDIALLSENGTKDYREQITFTRIAPHLGSFHETAE